eukprot:4643891-Pleurochrysis_carterae.AAC.2
MRARVRTIPRRRLRPNALRDDAAHVPASTSVHRHLQWAAHAATGFRGGLPIGRAAAGRGRVLPRAPRLRDAGRRRSPANLPRGEAS